MDTHLRNPTIFWITHVNSGKKVVPLDHQNIQQPSEFEGNRKLDEQIYNRHLCLFTGHLVRHRRPNDIIPRNRKCDTSHRALAPGMTIRCMGEF